MQEPVAALVILKNFTATRPEYQATNHRCFVVVFYHVILSDHSAEDTLDAQSTGVSTIGWISQTLFSVLLPEDGAVWR